MSAQEFANANKLESNDATADQAVATPSLEPALSELIRREVCRLLTAPGFKSEMAKELMLMPQNEQKSQQDINIEKLQAIEAQLETLNKRIDQLVEHLINNKHVSKQRGKATNYKIRRNLICMFKNSNDDFNSSTCSIQQSKGETQLDRSHESKRSAEDPLETFCLQKKSPLDKSKNDLKRIAAERRQYNANMLVYRKSSYSLQLNQRVHGFLQACGVARFE